MRTRLPVLEGRCDCIERRSQSEDK